MSANPEKKRKLENNIESDGSDSEEEDVSNFPTAGLDTSFESLAQKKPVRPREKRSEVWNYFDVAEVNSNGNTIKVGKCKNCPFYGKYSSSTSFMKEHVRKCKGVSHPPETPGAEEMKADGEAEGKALTTPKSAKRTPRTKLSHDAGLKERLTGGQLNLDAIWEVVHDQRRAKFPKALTGILEDLGVFEVNDLKSLDGEQFEVLGSLLKPAPLKNLNELLRG
jgi:hypothetical protein